MEMKPEDAPAATAGERDSSGADWGRRAKRVGIAPEHADPNLLPLLAESIPADLITGLVAMTDIAGGRGGVLPPWLPLSEAVCAVIAGRWKELSEADARQVLERLPRVAFHVHAREDAAIRALTDRLSQGVDYCLARKSKSAPSAERVAQSLAAPDGAFEREEFGLVVALLDDDERQPAIDALLADTSPVGVRGWMDLARDGLLSADDLPAIVEALDTGSWMPKEVAVACVAPLVRDAALRQALVDLLAGRPANQILLPDWYLCAVLLRLGPALDAPTRAAWTEILDTPYRQHIGEVLSEDDPTDAPATDFGLRAHPLGARFRQFFEEASPAEAAAFSEAALDALSMNFGGAPPMAAPPESEAAPAPPPAPRKRKRKRVRRSMRDRPSTAAAERPSEADGPGDPAPPAPALGPPAAAAPPVAPGAGALPPPPLERFVQAAVLHAGKRRLTFVAGTRNELLCWIGPKDDDDPRLRAEADQPVREDVIPDDGLELEVVLRYDDQSSTGKIVLPKDPRLRSTDCLLPLELPADEVHVIVEVAFLHQGRAFEIVRLDAPVVAAGAEDRAGGGLRIRTQVRRREVIELDDRQPFDGVALTSNAGLSVFGPRGAARFTLQFAAPAVEWLNKEIFATEKTLVRRRDDAIGGGLAADDPETLALFRDLAIHGNKLYGELAHQGFVDPGERLQVFNLEPSGYVPLEFVYDRGHPVEGAPLCDGWAEALAGDATTCGVCAPASSLSDEQRNAMPVICPLGFWSLQKIIERHDTPPGAADTQPSSPSNDLAALRPITRPLFASSHRVTEADRRETFAAIRAHFTQAETADDWATWRARIRDGAPELLVALPHHTVAGAMDQLEIGSGSRLSQDQLSALYVSPDAEAAGPVVVMIGCETQVQAGMGYVGFARDFARNRASVVIGTMAKVLGRHAAPVARSLVDELAAIESPERVGVLLRRLRRRMLARGYLMALCLVALGDGDWRLTPAFEGGP